jgi:hypothetical protein
MIETEKIALLSKRLKVLEEGPDASQPPALPALPIMVAEKLFQLKRTF